MKTPRRVCLFGAALACAVGCVAPNYVIDGPPGPSPDAAIAICEASLRYVLAPTGRPAKRSDPPRVVFLQCGLDETQRATLLERVKDLPVEFRPVAENYQVTRSDRWALLIAIKITWSDDRHAAVRIRSENPISYQGQVTNADARYESGEWRFYVARAVVSIN